MVGVWGLGGVLDLPARLLRTKKKETQLEWENPGGTV